MPLIEKALATMPNPTPTPNPNPNVPGSWSTHETPMTYREPRRTWGGIPPPPSYSSPAGASAMGANSDFGLRV